MKKIVTKLSTQLFVLGILGLFVSALSLFLGRQGIGLKIATYSFYFMVTGVLVFLFESKKNA